MARVRQRTSRGEPAPVHVKGAEASQPRPPRQHIHQARREVVAAQVETAQIAKVRERLRSLSRKTRCRQHRVCAWSREVRAPGPRHRSRVGCRGHQSRAASNPGMGSSIDRTMSPVSPIVSSERRSRLRTRQSATISSIERLVSHVKVQAANDLAERRAQEVFHHERHSGATGTLEIEVGDAECWGSVAQDAQGFGRTGHEVDFPQLRDDRRPGETPPVVERRRAPEMQRAAGARPIMCF